MKCGMNGVRATAVVLLLAAMIGVLSPTSAQESGVDPGAAAGPSIYVSVFCAYDESSGTSTCDFTPSDQAGGSTYGLSIPGNVLCAPVISTGTGTWSDSGVYGTGSISVALEGSVTAGGTATYGVETDGGLLSVPGDAIVCSAAAPGDADAMSDDVPEEVVEEIVPPAEDETTTAAEDVESAGDETVVEVVEEETGEEGAVNEEVPAPDVTVTVLVYDCDVDPSGDNPATLAECAPSAGVWLSATADDVNEGTTTTDGNGAAWFSVPDGSALVVVEDTSTIPSGYAPYGNGVAYATAAQDGVIVFVHLLEPIVGRLQIVNGSCPTSGETRTEFRVIEPRSVAMASTPECEATGGTVFTILGGTLGQEGMSVTTGDDGAWRGFLPAGTYTVVDDSTASADVTVIVDDISVVVVVDYVSHPIGVLNISRYLCDNAGQEGIAISFHGSEPTVGDDDDCVPHDGDIAIDVEAEATAANVATVVLGSDGIEEIELEPGNYTLTDITSGETASFAIEGGSRVWAVVQDLVVGDDGAGQPGGGNPDGENPDNGNPSPGDGTNVPGSGDGDPNAGGPDDEDDDAVDAGEGDYDDGDEVAAVTQLPAAGIGGTGHGTWSALLAVLAVIGSITAGALAVTRVRQSI